MAICFTKQGLIPAPALYGKVAFEHLSNLFGKVTMALRRRHFHGAL